MVLAQSDRLSSKIPGIENMLYEYGGQGYPRVKRVRADLMASVPAICPERALLITESYRETEGQPMVLRRAKALEKILANMSIFIEDEQLIVGNQAGQVRAAPVFPEYSFDWVIDELDQFAKRSGDVFEITEDTKQKLRSIQDFWKGKTHQDAVYADISETNMAAQKQNVIHRGGISMSGDGHIIPHHEKVLALGYRGLQQQARENLKRIDLTPEQRDFYQASVIALEAAINTGVLVNLLPFAGNALPFISSGGSSLVTVFAGVGILFGIARQSKLDPATSERSTPHAVVDLRRGDRRRSVSRPLSPSSDR